MSRPLAVALLVLAGGAAAAAQEADAGPDPRRDLDPLVGEWAVETTIHPGPDADPVLIEGRATKLWTLDGHYLREELASAGPDGEPVRGVGYLGYEAVRGELHGTWLSTELAGEVLSYRGEVGPEGRRFTFTGSATGPTGHELELGLELVVEGPDRHVLTVTYRFPDGSERTAFAMVYTRAGHPAAAVARAVLEAYRGRDLAALAPLSTDKNRARLEEILARGEEHPRWANLWSGWRWESVRAWDGELEAPRVLAYPSGRRGAKVPFARAGERVRVVELYAEGEGAPWRFHDIQRPTESAFEAWGEPAGEER